MDDKNLEKFISAAKTSSQLTVPKGIKTVFDTNGSQNQNIMINKNVAVSDSGFVLNASTGESFSVNPIGVEIINALKQGKSIEEISAELLNSYDVDFNTFEKDMNDFMDMLKFYHVIDTK